MSFTRTLITQALKSPAARLCVRSGVARSAVAIPRAANFSTTPAFYNQATTELKQILTSELDFEKNDAYGLDETFENYLRESQFEIVNTENKVLAELVKQNGDEKIHVFFDIQRITQASFEIRQLQEEMNSEEFDDNEELADSVYADVNVVVEKSGKAVGFDLALSIIGNQFSVVGVTNFEDASLALSDSADAAAKRDLLYSGPAFSNLAEELQESVNEYLMSRGVNEQLAEFILAYASVKENNEYISWLSKLKTFF